MAEVSCWQRSTLFLRDRPTASSALDADGDARRWWCASILGAF
jgi:hypothetical protein